MDPGGLSLRIVLLGLPGAGKGTQAVALAARGGVPHVATGNIFRQAIADRSALGLQVQAIYDAGALVPDALTIALVRDRLARSDSAAGFVLDGFPRTVPQASALDEMLEAQGHPLEVAIHLHVPAALVLGRLVGRRWCPNCGAVYHVESDPPASGDACRRCGTAVVQRADDREEVQRRRLEAYRAETEPLLPYYAAAGKLVTVDGAGSVQDVAARLQAAVQGGAA